MTDFLEPVMAKFLSFLRFVEFDDNINIFHLMQEQWKKKESGDDDSEDSEDSFEQPARKGILKGGQMLSKADLRKRLK